MNILIRDNRLRKVVNSSRHMVKEYGDRQAKAIRTRLDELAAADYLTDIFSIPQARCHLLTGNLANTFAVDLKHPYRMLFVVGNDPVPELPSGGIDLAQVTEIIIIGIEDYHG